MIALLRLARLYYALPMSLILLVTIAYAAGDAFAGQLGSALCATGALALVIAGGYALNDVCDDRIDRINSPRRPLPAGQVSPRVGGLWAALLLAAGLTLASWCRWPFLVGLAVVGAGVVVYDVTSKRLGVGKQLFVALLMTSFYPLALAQVGSSDSPRLPTLAAFPVWLFLTSFGYEILKDIRDIAGDRLVVTRPTWIQRRPARALRVARACLVAGALALVAPAQLGCGWVYVALIPAALVLAIVAAQLRPPAAMRVVYAEIVMVGVAATADLVILGP